MPKGVDLLVKIGSDSIAGQRNATLNMNADTIDKTTKDSAGWKESDPSFKSWSVDADGLLVETGSAYDALVTAFMAGNTVSAEVLMPSGDKYAGTAIITSFPISGPYQDDVTYSVTLQGTGALTKTAAV
jgi:TP901-1 family phage major tail protein